MVVKSNTWLFEIYDGIHTLNEIDDLKLKPIWQSRKCNVITDLGLAEIQKRDLGISTSINAYCGIGTGNDVEEGTDTVLSNEVTRKPVGQFRLIGTQAQYRTRWSVDDLPDSHNGSAEIWEAGLFTQLAGGIMTCRVVNDIPLILSAGKTLTTTIFSDIVHDDEIIEEPIDPTIPTTTIPDIVSVLSATANHLNIAVTWAAPNNGGEDILAYDIVLNDVLLDRVGADVLSYEITATTVGDQRIGVRAVNVNGTGAYGYVTVQTTRPPSWTRDTFTTNNTGQGTIPPGGGLSIYADIATNRFYISDITTRDKIVVYNSLGEAVPTEDILLSGITGIPNVAVSSAPWQLIEARTPLFKIGNDIVCAFEYIIGTNNYTRLTRIRSNDSGDSYVGVYSPTWSGYGSTSHFRGGACTANDTVFILVSQGDRQRFQPPKFVYSADITDDTPFTTNPRYTNNPLTFTRVFALDRLNSNASAITLGNDNKFYVADITDNKLYAYTRAGVRDSTSDIDLTYNADPKPYGLTFAEGHFYIADNDGKVYVIPLGTPPPPAAAVLPSVVVPTATANNLEITITWPEPNTGGAAISSYDITLDGALNQSVAGNTRTATITVSQAATFRIGVRAVNSVGNGPYGFTNVTTTQPPRQVAFTTSSFSVPLAKASAFFGRPSSGGLVIIGDRFYIIGEVNGTSRILVYDNNGTRIPNAEFGPAASRPSFSSGLAGYDNSIFIMGDTEISHYNLNGTFVNSADLRTNYNGLTNIRNQLYIIRGGASTRLNLLNSNLTLGRQLIQIQRTDAYGIVNANNRFYLADRLGSSLRAVSHAGVRESVNDIALTYKNNPLPMGLAATDSHLYVLDFDKTIYPVAITT
ncbi:MAG: fibronectin type III domain-containing protein [Thaumarchaeota archaeon]|nr:fibronectin type III domain-containing protein [Nitrososphaerota archaeon]